MADELPIPIEIPWQLASTTQPLGSGGPADTAISLFTFVPDSATLGDDFPDQKLVFLKVSTTLSPASLPASASPIATALGEGAPCFHAQLDMIVRLEDGQTGTIRPYFHAAAPMSREMAKTGVIGGESYSGAASQQAIGRSASHLYETSQSISSTSSVGASGSFLGFGASASFSTTDVAGRRSVDQVVDTTMREASQERRELVSHMTNVENVLTLLNTKYLGTPYLRFSMSPRPLEQLSIDPSDASLWFGQLLQRRSSGLEGVQEFTMVIIVPKDQDFCVTARLKRVCVLDDPPAEPDFTIPFNFNQHLVRVGAYLERLYPPGTPVDDLDVDIRHDDEDAFKSDNRPVIETWWFGADGRMIAGVIAVNGKKVANPGVVRGSAGYKTYVELWQEAQRDEYDRALSTSPLEDGVLLGETRTLDTCFTFTGPGALGVLNSSTSVAALRPIRITPADLGFAGPPTSVAASARSIKAKALETVTRWNSLAARLAQRFDNPVGEPDKRRGRFDDARLVDLLIRRLAKLQAGDPANLSLAELGKALKLAPTDVAALKKAGIGDLAALAQAMLDAGRIARRPAAPAPASPSRRAKGAAAGVFEPVRPTPSIDAKLVSAVRKGLADTVLAAMDRSEG